MTNLEIFMSHYRSKKAGILDEYGDATQDASNEHQGTSSGEDLTTEIDSILS